jgi:ketopantoate reductase
MNSKEKGDIAVGQAIAYYLSNKNEVCLPIGDKQKYDLIVDLGDRFLKVQCKYTTFKSDYGIYVVPLRVMGGNQSYHTAKTYMEGDFDILFVCTKSMDLYALPYEAVKHCKSNASLGKKYQKYKLTHSV